MGSREAFAFTRRDAEILDMLTLRVRAASRHQIADTWWTTSESGMRTTARRLDRLISRGLLATFRSTVIRLPKLYGPLVTWKPGQPMPEFGALSYQLMVRWTASTHSSAIYIATRKAAQIYGGRRKGRLTRPFQLSHDLGVTEMFLGIRRRSSLAIATWIDEERLAPHRRRQKLPDAMLAKSPTAPDVLLLEFGGAYGKGRLMRFHDDAQDRGCSYEIW